MGKSFSCLKLKLKVRDEKGKEDYGTIVTAAAKLPEDVLAEILFRLPRKSISRFRSVSKQWHALLTDPVLITKSQFHRFKHYSPWTLFFQFDKNVNKNSVIESICMEEIDTNKFYWKDGRLHPKKPLSRRREQLQFTCHDFSFKFLQKQLKKHQHLYLVASDNGLVLCSTTKTFQMDYFVCNPLTKKWVALPRPRNRHEWVLNGFICESETESASSYKVVRITVPYEIKSTSLEIEEFSSESGKWNRFVVSCPQPIIWENRWRDRDQHCNGVITNNGVLYWIESTSGIIAYHHSKTGAGHCELINLPAKPTEQGRYTVWSCLGSFRGSIGYCESRHGPLSKSSLSVWLLDVENGRRHSSAWRLVRKIDPSDMMKSLEGPFNPTLVPLAFHPATPNIVILGYDSCIVACDMKIEGFGTVLRRFPQIYSEYEATFRGGYGVLPFVLTSRPTTVPPPSWSESLSIS